MAYVMWKHTFDQDEHCLTIGDDTDVTGDGVFTVSKIGSTAFSLPDGSIEYTLLVEHVSGEPVTGIRLVDQLPAGVTGTFSDTTYTLTSSGYYLWSDITVSAAEPQHTITFVGTFDPTVVSVGDEVCNTIIGYVLDGQ